MNQFPEISVIIPVKNEARYLSACIEGILSQTVPVKEIIVIDSGSTDGTQDIALRYPIVKLLQIKPEEFNHGDTRNYGASQATGDYLIFTVGDSRPQSNDWIGNMLKGFINDSVAAVCGSQVVAHDKNTNPVEWYKPVTIDPVMISFHYKNAEEFNNTPASEKRQACGWDNVSAMYRKSVWKKIPFKKIVYGEDVYWAIDALQAGFTLVYCPAAKVYHFHKEDYRTVLKRTIAVCYLRYSALGSVPDHETFLIHFMKYTYRIMREASLSFSEKYHWISYNYNLVRAINTGVKLFENARLSNNKQELESLFRKYCGSPPIPVKHK